MVGQNWGVGYTWLTPDVDSNENGVLCGCTPWRPRLASLRISCLKDCVCRWGGHFRRRDDKQREQHRCTAGNREGWDTDGGWRQAVKGLQCYSQQFGLCPVGQGEWFSFLGIIWRSLRLYFRDRNGLWKDQLGGMQISQGREVEGWNKQRQGG